MKIKTLLILVLVFSLILFGCAKEEVKDMKAQQSQPDQQQVSVGNASFLYEVADLMVDSTRNSTNSPSG